ncbi:uncharacterized protein BP01DRAFT_390235 [Aspergillus saccharolyticus JOP 1030-1]|uniref:Uncharacterized protein n=1 Tax=Aspergillus saccharolyticus JOP 1030-1 TaxID=1450539 RepID=A0A318ZHR3_9EURO|nr:hypothetical protein BP01DRAFT_390235 [Aspergillus saccharolyticus JOP 1030-1]PYH47111.1 hypothetical protein BP01DRAFT_390235 [Aspergillus saccharolyticus JOP 1030-1]
MGIGDTTQTFGPLRVSALNEPHAHLRRKGCNAVVYADADPEYTGLQGFVDNATEQGLNGLYSPVGLAKGLMHELVLDVLHALPKVKETVAHHYSHDEVLASPEVVALLCKLKGYAAEIQGHFTKKLLVQSYSLGNFQMEVRESKGGEAAVSELNLRLQDAIPRFGQLGSSRTSKLE